nr:MAG TPA: hypothetical protein [Caudoviricetes sp.]
MMNRFTYASKMLKEYVVISGLSIRWIISVCQVTGYALLLYPTLTSRVLLPHLEKHQGYDPSYKALYR